VAKFYEHDDDLYGLVIVGDVLMIHFSRNTLYSGADKFLRKVMILALSKG
jgi:hypothetical protein